MFQCEFKIITLGLCNDLNVGPTNNRKKSPIQRSAVDYVELKFGTILEPGKSSVHFEINNASNRTPFVLMRKLEKKP